MLVPWPSCRGLVPVSTCGVPACVVLCCFVFDCVEITTLSREKKYVCVCERDSI